MATSSTISKLNKDGTLTTIYCHSDGYPSGVGAILSKYYNNESLVDRLLELGNLSTLGKTPIDNPQLWDLFNFEKIKPEEAIKIMKDNLHCRTYKGRGETNTEAKTIDRKDLHNNYHSEYDYVYTDGKWFLLDGDKFVAFDNRPSIAFDESKQLTEGPDEFGLTTDDELDDEEAKLMADLQARMKAKRDKIKAERDKAIAKQTKAKEMLDQIEAEHDKLTIQEQSEPLALFNIMFNILVPSEGSAETLAGEVIRALNYIYYRYYNDGDYFYEGYGFELCAGPAKFVCNNLGDMFKELFDEIAEDKMENYEYEDAIVDICEKVSQYIISTDHGKDLLTTSNNGDCHQEDGIEDYWEDVLPKYEITSSIPENVTAHIEAEHISDSDVVDKVTEWVEDTGCYNAEIEMSYWGGEIEITNLDRDTYDQLNGYIYDWLEDWGYELDSDYPFEIELGVNSFIYFFDNYHNVNELEREDINTLARHLYDYIVTNDSYYDLTDFKEEDDFFDQLSDDLEDILNDMAIDNYFDKDEHKFIVRMLKELELENYNEEETESDSTFEIDEDIEPSEEETPIEEPVEETETIEDEINKPFEEYDLNGFWINGSINDFVPEDLINKLKEKKERLHTNRLALDTEDKKEVYHIVVGAYGHIDNPNYVETTVMKVIFNGENKEYETEKIMFEFHESWEEAIEALENFKSNVLSDGLQECKKKEGKK